jgi:phosphatidylinositol glycan class F
MSTKSGPAARAVPIATLNTPLSNVYWHLQPVLVLSVLYRHFAALVADPVSTLSTLLLHLVASQSLYTVLCLPPVPRPAAPTSTTAPKKKPAAPPTTTLLRRIIVRPA